ncbi:unnamed protein product [Closterium sp. Naga37s-1]|nr:unnamed protein product [Closterium sp. Naga37s-1]
MSRQVARALLGRAEPLLQRHVACSGGASSHAVTSYIGNGHRHACGRVKPPVLPVNVNPMLSPSYGARRFSSSASAESAPKHKPDLLRILAACALGSGATAGVAVSIMDPKTFSALSFAATDYMTPFIRLLDLSALSFAATDYMTPFIRLLDPETSHQLAVLSGEWGLTPRDFRPDPPSLATTVWGRRFSNPVGMAAGFDKDARCVDSMFALGLGFTEIGSVTPLPQPGNPKPRCFRLTDAGIADVAERLGAWQARRQQQAAQEQKRAANGQAPKKENVVEERVRDGVLAVNLGKNKTSEDAAGDYVKGVHALGQFADVLVVNVSSPNTPGLRKLQGRSQLQELLQRDAAGDYVKGVHALGQFADVLVVNVSSPNTPGLRKLQGWSQLQELLQRVQAARNEMEWGKEGPPPLLLKIAPDLTTEDMSDIAAVALFLKIDGLVVSNTTISRPDSILGLVNADEVGGLSGKPLFELSTAVLRQMYSLTKVSTSFSTILISFLSPFSLPRSYTLPPSPTYSVFSPQHLPTCLPYLFLPTLPPHTPLLSPPSLSLSSK